MSMKNTHYFIILALLVAVGFLLGWYFHVNGKYWIIAASVLVLYIWCKDVFTGKNWFQKPASSKKIVPKSTGLSNSGSYQPQAEQIYPLLSDTEKQGYLQLIKLCALPGSQIQLIKFVQGLMNFDGDPGDLTTLNYVMRYLDENEIHLIMSLDWKAKVEDLEWRVSHALKDNYGISISLPRAEDFNEQETVSSDGVFEQFDKPLRHVGFQLGFIDTQSDEYVIIIHKTQDKNAVKSAVNNIGYKYFEK